MCGGTRPKNKSGAHHFRGRAIQRTLGYNFSHRDGCRAGDLVAIQLEMLCRDVEA